MECDESNDSEESQMKLLQEWKSSGMGLRAWCLQTGHKFHKMRYLARKVKRSAPAQGFVEVFDKEDGQAKMALYVGSLRIELLKDFDPVLLKQVVQALGGAIC